MAQYNVNNIMVSSLLSSIRDGTIAIPEIQRPFVWDPTKVRDLIDSLYKGYLMKLSGKYKERCSL